MIVWPGLRRSVSAISRLFNSASFAAPLTHSAIPTRAASGTTATFTRATPKTVTNNDGYLVTLLAGEIGFPGARRVRNLINAASSENLNAAGWTLATATFTGAKLSESAGVATHYAYPAALSLTAGTYIWSAEVSAAGRDYFTLSLNGAGTLGTYFNLATGAVISNIGAATGSIELLSNGNYRVSTKAVLTAASYTPLLLLSDGSAAVPSYAGDTSKGVNVFNAQLEDVTSQTTQTAGEYVSVGVESAPYYHGSMVDGVKCFPTDLSGNPIPLTTMLGYLAQGARTNLCLQSQTFDNASWVKTAATISANSKVAPDGTTTADSLVEDNSAASAHLVNQSIAKAASSAAYTLSVYVEKGGRDWVALTLYDEVSLGARAWFNVNTGVVGATANIGAGMGTITTTIEHVIGGIYRCSMSVSASGTGVAISPYIYSTDADSNLSPATGLNAVGLYLYGAQVELGSFASSYIATTTVAVTRDPDILTYSSGDVPNLKTLCATFKREVGVSSVSAIAAIDNVTSSDFALAYLASATAVRCQTADNSVEQANILASNAYVPGAESTVCFSVAANDVKMAFDGVAQTQDTSGTAPTTTVLSVGHYANGNIQTNGNVGGIYGWTRNLSQSELNAVTS